MGEAYKEKREEMDVGASRFCADEWSGIVMEGHLNKVFTVILICNTYVLYICYISNIISVFTAAAEAALEEEEQKKMRDRPSRQQVHVSCYSRKELLKLTITNPKTGKNCWNLLN